MPRPHFIFDGDCSFCRRWVLYWRQIVKDKSDFSPYQTVFAQYPDIPVDQFKNASHYIDGDGRLTMGAAAVFNLLSLNKNYLWLNWAYEKIPGAKYVSEWFYRLVAQHRKFFSFLTQLIWGQSLSPTTYIISRWIFIRSLGLIYFIAFLSIAGQILGLVGSDGVLPAQNYLNAISQEYGMKRFFLLPTVFWLGASDMALVVGTMAGVFLSFLLIIGVFPVLILAALWFLYLSTLSVSQIFLSFQWDILLLEAGFLAIFLCGWQLRSNIAKEKEPAGVMIWLYKWLLFRLIFTSGVVKLASGDPTWSNLTALSFHYETQPLPAWTSWFAHHLPFWIHRVSAMGMFFIELVVPFFIFAPRRIRYGACFLIVGLQLFIGLTGNYTFFNILTIILCLFLLDDSFWPRKIIKKVQDLRNWSPDYFSPSWPRWTLIVLSTGVIVLTTMHMTYRMGVRLPWPSPFISLARAVAPFHTFNSYGLFAVMTTERPEIIIEGSNDGKIWDAYEFKYKPGQLNRRPRFIEPFQPRLDWQMWFAALGNFKQNQWVISLCYKLLQGAVPVENLLAHNPFNTKPPRYIRATLYRYNFTQPSEKKLSGNWWKREEKGLYFPVLTLENGKLAAPKNITMTNQ